MPAPQSMVRANSTCFPVKLPSGLSLNCCPRTRTLFSGVRSSWGAVGEEFRFVLGGERKLLGLFFNGAAGLVNFLVLTFHFHVLFGKLLGLLRKLFVGLAATLSAAFAAPLPIAETASAGLPSA